MSKNKEHPDSEDDGEDLFNQVLNGSANVMGGKGALDDIYLVKGTQHAADAIDFEDEDELAEDEEDSVAVDEGASGSGLGSGLGGADSSIKDDGEQAADDMFDDVFGEQNEDEGALQQKADNDFDDIFGEDDDSSNQRTLDSKNDTLFNDLGVTDDFDENAELNFEMFEDDIPDIDTNGNNANGMDTIATTGGDLKKRKLDEQSRRSAKKAKLEKIVDKLEKRLRRKNLSKFFPEYSKDKPYNNHSLFLPSARFFSFLRPPISQKPNPKALLPTKVTLELEPDQRKAFRSGKSHHRKNERKTGVTDIVPSDYSLIEELQRRDEYGFTNFKPVPFLSLDGTKDNFGSLSKDLIFSSTSWDDDLIINGGKEIADVEKIKKLQIRKELGVPDNLIDTKFQELEDGGEDGGEDEFEDDIFNGTISNYTTLKLDMNDPNLIFLPDKKQTETSTKSMAVIPTNEKMMESKFNISNDQEYELLRKNYNIKVRSQLSNLTIDHSIPAMRLQTPYYKVRLNKAECRSFHRPKFVVRPGALMNFSKLKLRKKKKDRGKSLQEIFQKTSDLTISDTASIVGMEYSEEYPPIVLNFGMGSKIINYYRKEKSDDYARPKAPIGETHVLGVEDRSPFWNFGHVAKGDFVPTLYNNLVRAPIFKHEVKTTDFLLIRSQGAGNHTRHYLRPMNHLFAVGQVFPAVEIPAPHSRKITNTSKNRLKIIVYRTMNKQGEQRISVKDISHHFPDQNDMQNRQRLKEFMEYQRHGDDQGFWKMKNNAIIPNEDEIRTMITPEDLCLLDSMQNGQQMLEDFVYIFRSEEKDQSIAKEKEKEKEKDKKEKKKDKKEESEKEATPKVEDNTESTTGENSGKKLTEKERKKRERDDKEKDMEEVEEELSTWNTSRNFINANQTKANLQLNGEGDPTGIGLGFSFLRATQKNNFTPMFTREDPSIKDGKALTTAQQQKIYEDEVSRIWYAQRRSLTVESNNDHHNLDTIYKEYKPAKPAKIDLKDITENKNSVLKITRRYRDENNIVQRRVTSIKDPILIRAYLKRKKQIEDDLLRNAEVDDIIPTNDKELNRLRRKALEEKLANLEKRAKLSKGKKISKDALHAAAAAGGTIIDANTVMLPDGSYAIGGKGIGKGKSRTRRCAACGALGHIKTNKSCPLFNQPKPTPDSVPLPPVNTEQPSQAAQAAPQSAQPSISPPIPQ